MSYRRGLAWVSRQTLMIQPNNTTNAISPLLQRGPGYRLPTDSSFAPLDTNTISSTPTADEMVEATNLFFDKGVHPKAICFGGGYSEPLANLSEVVDAMSAIRSKRHGVPLVLMTNGLINSNTTEKAEDTIIQLHEEWSNMPGSDGDSKLSVFVNIAGANPPQYKKVMQPTETKKGFQEMTGFVATLAEAGIRVYGTASEFPKIKMKQVEALAFGIGCSDFFVRTYHERTLYDALGLSFDEYKGNGHAESIKLAFREKAKLIHPDRNHGLVDEEKKENERLMREVTEAFDILGDSEKKRLYDDSGVADLMLNEHETDYFSSVVNKSM